jgi:hypothetical protein
MKYIASAAGGFLLACVLFMVFVVPKVKQTWWTQGQTEGALKTNIEIHRKAMKHFPENSMSCAFVETLSGAKPDTTDIVDCGSYKTLRIAK